MYYDSRKPFDTLKGKTIEKVTGGPGSSEIVFYCTDGSQYKMLHFQDCCEDVHVESIDADLNEILVGQEVLVAEEITNAEGKALCEYEESWTWTFYKLATAKGWATIRWYGSSNGYYSEGVDFVEIVGPSTSDE